MTHWSLASIGGFFLTCFGQTPSVAEPSERSSQLVLRGCLENAHACERFHPPHVRVDRFQMSSMTVEWAVLVRSVSQPCRSLLFLSVPDKDKRPDLDNEFGAWPPPLREVPNI